MTDLVEFLTARLTEDEEAAKHVSQPYRLYVSNEGRLAEPLTDDEGNYVQWADGDDRMPNHITNWSLIYDPARVLREVEAKQRIIQVHHGQLVEATNADGVERSGRWCAECDYETFPCRTLRLLALPYADHPDYQQEWRA